ncbi:hypothetical protein L1887_58334 [Cichorium endivia]|nr:hypothetical protein L1887_58334 [Cichorium endivia]
MFRRACLLASNEDFSAGETDKRSEEDETMPTQQPVQNSRAHRWAYACGLSVKRSYRRLKTFESRVVERAETAGVPAAVPFQGSDTPDSDDLDDPMHRTSWPERYDKWGSLK